ncbi:MAG TPA: radical SAM protein [Thermoguttaceae bacterium]|nr:radical SAM protein [Thermoguttaceae bacterium]
MRIDRIGIITTTACNLHCPHCGQGPLRQAFPDYSLSLDDLHTLIDRAAALDVQFSRVSFTGGEPTLWPSLSLAVDLFRAAWPATKILMFSNAARPERIRQLAPRVDLIRLSRYPGRNDREVDALAGLDHVSVCVGAHHPLPTGPVPDSLPARCDCPAVGYFHHRVYLCNPSAARLCQIGMDPFDPAHSRDVLDDWAAWVKAVGPARFERALCQSCISNRKTWQKPKTPKTPSD